MPPKVRCANTLAASLFPETRRLVRLARFRAAKKARLVLAAIIRQKPNLLLLDEPTNHLDLEMRHALGIALQEFTGALVVVSHDRHLLQSVSDTLKFIHDGVVDDFDGDLDDYARWLLRTRNEDKPASTEANVQTNGTGGLSAQEKKARKREEAEQRQRTSELRKNISRLEKLVDQSQKELGEITDLLSDNALYEPERKADLKRLLDKQARIKQQLFAAENDWMEQTEILEQVSP